MLERKLGTNVFAEVIETEGMKLADMFDIVLDIHMGTAVIKDSKSKFLKVNNDIRIKNTN